jgi:hypothetical protein
MSRDLDVLPDVEAEALRLLPKPAPRSSVKRTYTPSVHLRPLPGAPGAPPRGALLDLDDLEEVA